MNTEEQKIAALEKENANLNKALALKLDGLPSGLSAGQSIALEKKLALLEKENAELRRALFVSAWPTNTLATVAEDQLCREIIAQLKWASPIIREIEARAAQLVKLARECYAGPKNPTA